MRQHKRTAQLCRGNRCLNIIGRPAARLVLVTHPVLRKNIGLKDNTCPFR